MANGEKKRQVEINDYLSIPTVTHYLNSKNALELLINSINSTIRTEEIDGKEYYSVTNLIYSGSYTVSENIEKVILYFEKDTGLMTRKIEITKNG